MDKIQFCNLLSPDSAFSWRILRQFPAQHAPFYWQRGKRPQLKINGRHQEKMLLCLTYPHTYQMLPHSWPSACGRTGSPATSNKGLQVRFLKTKQLQTCSLIAWRKVCSEDLILQCWLPSAFVHVPVSSARLSMVLLDLGLTMTTNDEDDMSNGRKSRPF